MMTDKLPFEAATDLETLLRVQKAEFTPPEKAKPARRPAVLDASSCGRCGSRPSERYQTADEMLVDVERVLRTEFQSAGQTELKLWLEQLARRDGSPSIGKTRPGHERRRSTDGGGTDCRRRELVRAGRLRRGGGEHRATRHSRPARWCRAVRPARAGKVAKGLPPIPQPTPQGLAPVAPEMAPPPRDAAAMRAVDAEIARPARVLVRRDVRAGGR